MADKQLEDKARIFKALAHPTRLFIVETLAEQRRCVSWLADQVEVDISTVSRHLDVLEEAGIIHGEKEGKTVYYSLRITCVVNFFSCVEEVLESDEQKKVC